MLECVRMVAEKKEKIMWILLTFQNLSAFFAISLLTYLMSILSLVSAGVWGGGIQERNSFCSGRRYEWDG